MKLLVGVYDTTSKIYDKFMIIDELELNNFVKGIKVLVNEKTDDVYSVYSDDYEIHKIANLSESGITNIEKLNIILRLGTLKEVNHE